MSSVGYDRRAVTIDGKRTLILSGAIHYPRSTPAMWPLLCERSREAGLNTVETYVFWNLHERRRGVFDFSDRLDLVRFCRVAQEHGLHVILRIGPYICSETNYGGFPAWLRDVPGMQMRTYNEPFMTEMGRWVRLLCEHVRPMFAPNGGPIILAQIENEYGMIMKKYGEAGGKYAKWAIDLGLSLNLGIPWIMCVGGAPGAIETLNGFYVHEFIDKLYEQQPDKPALWTEAWPGWYDTFGFPHRSRPAEEVAYGTARFVAAGGTGVNYYMWHGGTNFGRETMFLQTTSYDFTAPLDEYGLTTTKSNHLARLHKVLAARAEVLLGNDRPAPQPLGPKQVAFVYGTGPKGLAFLCNDDPQSAADVSFGGKGYKLPPISVSVVEKRTVLVNTGEVDPASIVKRSMKPAAKKLSTFARRAEPLPDQWPEPLRATVTAKEPIEQLLLTRDETDYCWYCTTVKISKREAGMGMLTLSRAADVIHVFADGKIVASTRRLVEQRGAPDTDDMKQSLTMTLEPGTRELSILCTAIGLIKGDWQLGGKNMAEERKGLWGPVYWNERKLDGPWRMQPGLVGERCAYFAEPGEQLAWKALGRADRGKPLSWWRATFESPNGKRAIAVDLKGMNKGIAWLNGRCIGRYWLVTAGPEGDTWRKAVVRTEGEGEPTQRYYHLPSEWLRDRNVLVLFEEAGGDPSSVRLVEWK